jgi:spore coat protein H
MKIKILFIFITLLGIIACNNDSLPPDEEVETGNHSPDSLTYNPDWTFQSHGKSFQNYSLVFPQSSVNRIEIVMATETWKAIRTNMTSLFGFDFGGSSGGPGGSFPDAETNYVNVLVKFDGKSWKDVGFRLKGNSSLSQIWKQGVYKLPFRLNFDKFEDTYPGITNQHFYGFKELSFSPSFKDQSLMREKITPDIFRLAGIPAAQTAFYRVYIDFGLGLKYCGLYTCVELPDDNMIKEQYGEESGNIYKPESRLSNFIESQFEKKNNEVSPDYSDVRAFINVLNSSLRTSDTQVWKTNLEAVFNVEQFLKYLAVNNAICNWDSYGNMAHNYYLYNHSVKKLVWIPWDHNEALTGTTGITGTPNPGGGGVPGQNALSLSMNEVAANWPLIRYLADDPAYMVKYKSYLKSFKDNVFTETAMNSLLDKYYGMISLYVTGAEGEQPGYTFITNSASFQNALTGLKAHVVARRALITTYVP